MQGNSLYIPSLRMIFFLKTKICLFLQFSLTFVFNNVTFVNSKPSRLTNNKGQESRQKANQSDIHRNQIPSMVLRLIKKCENEITHIALKYHDIIAKKQY